MLKLSSTWIQRLAHQLSPNPPRFDCALIPPSAFKGRDGAKYRSLHRSLRVHLFATARASSLRLRISLSFGERIGPKGE